MTLQELWIITHEGEELFYYSLNTQENPKRQLSNSFIQGVHKVAQDFGGDTFFTLDSAKSFILGKDYKHKVMPVYIVGVFGKGRNFQKKKLESILNALEEAIKKLDANELRNRNNLNNLLINIIKKKI